MAVGNIRVMRNGEAFADIYEYYWAPKTARKLSVGSVLLWMGKQSFPRRTQIGVRNWSAFSKQLVNVGLIVGTLALGLALTVAVLNLVIASVSADGYVYLSWSAALEGLRSTRDSLLSSGGTDLASWLSALLNPVRPLQKIADGTAGSFMKLVTDLSVLLAAGGAIAYFLLQSFRHAFALVSPRPGDSSCSVEPADPPAGADPKVPRLTAFVLSVLSLGGLGGSVWIAGTAAVAGLAVLVGWIVRRGVNFFVKDLFGDVVAYLDRDEHTEWYSARREIMDDGMEVYTALLGFSADEHFKAAPCGSESKKPDLKPDCGYKRVLVVGHSLGSVIGLDIMRQFVANVRAYFEGDQQAELLTRFAGFITLGSPLGYVSYVYGRRDNDTNRLGFLFTDNVRSLFMHGATWENRFFLSDPFANLLAHLPQYQLLDDRIDEEQLLSRWAIPVISHTRYFDSHEVICLIRQRIEHIEA